jgi:plastocyanin
MRWLRVGLAAAFLILSAAAWSASAASRQVYIRNRAFLCSPSSASCNINQGDVVFWANQDDTTHNVTADSGSWSTGNIAPGAEGSHTFATAGSFPYHCSIHPEMKGSFNVAAGAVVTTVPPATTVPSGAATTRTTARATATTAKAGAVTSTTIGPQTTVTDEFGVLAPTTTIDATTTTAGQVAIKEDKGGGGTSGIVIAALIVPILGVLAGGGYALYRLGSRRTP